MAFGVYRNDIMNRSLNFDIIFKELIKNSAGVAVRIAYWHSRGHREVHSEKHHSGSVHYLDSR